ncbi:hypothetical protein [Streptomyces collinus]|uniref:hypothetical protein n=1 Tax=Streptomyces collinus TaxID=42684 RepID=UPI0036F19353
MTSSFVRAHSSVVSPDQLVDDEDAEGVVLAVLAGLVQEAADELAADATSLLVEVDLDLRG